MKKRSIFARIIPVLMILVYACTSDYNLVLQKSETTFYKGDYMGAAKMLLGDINKKNQDQLLLMMEAGMMLHTAGEFKKSNSVFLKAAKLSKKIATSVRKQAASLFLNDRVTNYKGEDFERVLIHVYTGINFIMLNDQDSARVEFKNVNNLLRAINVESGKKYKQNLMAKFLTAIAFEMSGVAEKDINDTEFAYVEYKQIHKLAPKNNMVKRDLLRMAKALGDMEDYRMWQRKFGNIDNVPKNAGEFVLLFGAGQGAIKVSRGSVLSDRAFANSLRVAVRLASSAKAGVTSAAVLSSLKSAENPIPKFKKRSNRVSYLEVLVNGKYAGRTTQLEDIATTAVKNMEEQYVKMSGKVAAGIATKAVAAVAAGLVTKKLAQQSEKTSGIASLLGAVVGIATGAGLASQIKPDLRCWHTIPSKLHLGRFFLKPGNYDVTINQKAYNGRTIGTNKIKVSIKKGMKSILNFRTLY